MDPRDRPDLIPLIDLDAEQADDVCDAMTNVGLEVIREDLGRDPNLDDYSRGLVRLYVPRAQLRDARDVVLGVLPEYGPPARPETLPHSEEETWSQIVAGLRADGLGSTPPAPINRAPDHLDPDVGGYQPPHPPPMPRLSRSALLSWAALLIGLGLLLVTVSSERTGIALLGGLVLFIGGFAGVISLARSGRSDDDDLDDGAVV